MFLKVKNFLTLSAILAILLLAGNPVTAASEKTIPYPPTYDITRDGASQFLGKMNINDSPYFPKIDFFNLKSTANLTILPNYKTYQQSNSVTCGPAAALTVLNHFGITEYSELWLAGQMGTQQKVGTNTAGMAAFFEKIGWQVESSLTAKPINNLTDFAAFVNEKLRQNTPIMVENIDWGGHWRVIIGYDTMGTTTIGDDVLILADPFDTADHQQDGYVVESAEKFFYLWFDVYMMPDDQKYHQWLVVKPAKK